MRSALVDYYCNQLKWPSKKNPMHCRDIKLYTAGFKKKRAQDKDFNTVRANPYTYQAMEKSFILFDKDETYESEFFFDSF